MKRMGIVVAMVVAGWASPALAVVDVFVKGVSLTPSTVLQEGSKHDVGCDWGWNVTPPFLTGNGQLTVHDSYQGQQKEIGKKTLSPVTGAGSSNVKFPWEAKGGGLHTLQCKVVFSDSTGLYNLKETVAGPDNVRFLAVQVPQSLTPGYFPSSSELLLSCQASVGASLELDVATLKGPGELAAQPAKQKATLPLIKSQPFLNTVQCGYGVMGVASVMYAFKCTNPKAVPNKPHTFACKK
jgi:hypothetical protein